MNTKPIVCTIAALCMNVGGVALAQNDKDVRADRAGQGSFDTAVPLGRGDRVRPADDRGRGGNDRGAPRFDNRQDNRHDNRYDNRQDNRHDNRYDNRHDNRQDNRYDNRRDDRYDNRYEPRPDYRDRRATPGSNGNGNGNGYGNGYGHGYRDGRGAGPNHSFYRGGRLPMEYRHRQYVVDDWRGHRLNAPPRGYHWVQTGGDYVLIAITTGIIASILLGQ